MIPPDKALMSLEFMLRNAVDSISRSGDRTDLHIKLLTILAEILPIETLHSNIDQVIQMITAGLLANKPSVQQSSINILNQLLGTNYTMQDMPELLQSK